MRPPPPLLPLVCGAAALAASTGGTPPVNDVVSVSLGGSSPRPLVHYWKRCFGSGHALLTLRQDWRDSLTAAVHELGLRGIRHHGLLDDDMGVVTAAPGSGGSIYNFSKISSSWDYQVALGVDPVVELSFMPAFLANCTWHKYATGESPTVDAIVNPHGNGSCVTGNFYEGSDMQPQRWEDWHDLVFALASHAVERYGLDVVERWHWEVWNGACESELSWCPFSLSTVGSACASSELTTVARLRVVSEFWGMPFSGNTTDYSPYMRLYNASAHAIKRVNPTLKVGGPSSNGGVCCIETVRFLFANRS